MSTKTLCDNCGDEITHKPLIDISGTTSINDAAVNISVSIDGADICIGCLSEVVREVVEGRP